MFLTGAARQVGIPALAFKGLAIQKFSLLPWSYIAVFFCLRAALFLLWVIIDIGIFFRTRNVGTLTADYMNSTWINTVIFGIPIYVALYGPKFAVFPIFASISSFFFQLPLQLLLFEIERRRNPLPETPSGDVEKPDVVGAEKMAPTGESDSVGEGDFVAAKSWSSLELSWEGSSLSVLLAGGKEAKKEARIATWKYVGRTAVSVLLNPIIIAIVGGVLFSLTGWTLPVYLDVFCTLTGDAVTPMAAFAIGVFSFRKPSSSGALWLSVTIQLVIKFFIMPLLVMPFLLAFSIVGVPRQMGVLMAALPVALSCYVLSVRYRFQEEHAAIMVVLSTILMLPTQLMWIAITDSIGWGVPPP